MMNGNTKVSNPLTLMAIFAGLTESISVGILPLLTDPDNISDLIWFTTWFPFTLLVLFFLTLNFNHKVLYSPSDFENQSHFVGLIQGGYSGQTPGPENTVNKIEAYLTPAGTPQGEYDGDREKELEQWLETNSEENISLTMFLFSGELEELRSRFIREKGL